MEKAGLQLVDIRVTVRDWISACKLVAEGMGVAIVPELALPEALRNLCVVPVTLPYTVSFGWSVRHPERLPAQRRRY